MMLVVYGRRFRACRHVESPESADGGRTGARLVVVDCVHLKHGTTKERGEVMLAFGMDKDCRKEDRDECQDISPDTTVMHSRGRTIGVQ